MHMKRLAGVHRPGIAVTIPAFHGPVVLCDAGANPEPRPSHLWQYGVMSEVVAKQILGIENPRVAQMNIGSEEGKGTGMIQSVRELLRKTPGMNYIGYVEGRDLFEGVADVVVTDGFVGNTLLKMAEGLLRAMGKGAIDVYSAGTKPGTVRPEAIAVMAERGLDISDHRSKHVDEFVGQTFDYVITVCDNASETCPVFPGAPRRVHWSLPDPAAVEFHTTSMFEPAGAFLIITVWASAIPPARLAVSAAATASGRHEVVILVPSV
jgi:hypothetical protein